MGFKDFNLKLKAIRVRRFVVRDFGNKKRKESDAKSKKIKPSWMMPISHGFRVVEDPLVKDNDLVVVQREEIEQVEFWFFGVFDAKTGYGVTHYIQSHLFEKNLNESQIRKKSKETLRKACLEARAKSRKAHKTYDDEDDKQTWRASSASVMVLNGEKLVIGNMGEYRAIVCRNGVAHEIYSEHHRNKQHWTQRLFLGHLLAWRSSNARESKRAELAVGSEKIDSGTEFVVIASAGIWEVMKNQEVVNLIRHIEDPQQAADCLAKEASSRMSRANISCLVISFD